MKKKLYILPPHKNLGDRISYHINRAMSIHRRLSQLNPKPSFIPEFTYEIQTVDELVTLFEKGFSFPEDSVYEVASLASKSIQVQELATSLHRYERLISDVKRLESDSTYYQSSTLEKHNLGLRNNLRELNQKSRNLLPVLTVVYKEDYSFGQEHIKGMGENESWVEEIIEIFRMLTEAHVIVEPEKIDYDSFLFTKSGHIAAFIDFNSLKLAEQSEYITEQNLRSLAVLLHKFYSYYLYEINPNPPVLKHNSAFERLSQRMQVENELHFSDFKEVLAYFKGEKAVESEEERIGVFLDVANIYTDLKNMQIDYLKLFSKLYGIEHVKNIKDKFAYFFEPVYESEEKTRAFREKQKVLKSYLREQGFHIETSGNNQAKAKQWKNGVEHDEDDFKLIQRMEERFKNLTSVLLLSGDEDYLAILDKYQEGGRKVKVLSVHPDTTSKQLTNKFEHSYLIDHYDCILF